MLKRLACKKGIGTEGAVGTLELLCCLSAEVSRQAEPLSAALGSLCANCFLFTYSNHGLLLFP